MRVLSIPMNQTKAAFRLVSEAWAQITCIHVQTTQTAPGKFKCARCRLEWQQWGRPE
jgi:hypothetical protein